MFSLVPRNNYQEFIQACRAFKPSELIPALARLSASLGEPPYSNQVKRQLPPWGLAAAARESLLHGSEHRNEGVSDKALDNLMRKFFNSESKPHVKPGDPTFLLSLVTPILYEQFPWQESMYEEIARSHAMLLDGLGQVNTSVVTADSLAEILGGMSLSEGVGAAFVLQVGAQMNGGVFDPAWLSQSKFEDVLKVFPRSNIETLLKRLTATREEFKQDFTKNSLYERRLARYDYNPLVRTPFIEFDQSRPITPAPRLIMRTVTPGGLYYSGVSRYGNVFANDLGKLFEHYIGRNLRLIEGAEVHPEIVYGKNQEKSVDWLVVMPDLVLLVECKLKRLALAARAGDPKLFEDLKDSLSKARGQLARTVENLASRRSEFGHIPTDRPMLGLIVSAEPIYSAAAYLLDHDTALIPGGTLPDVPVAAASSREIEALVTHGADTQDVLLALMRDQNGGAISLRGVRAQIDRKNPILEKAWRSYGFPHSDRLQSVDH
ncbi:hypothetical protein [Nocardia gipuzkoensis]|uniref:hypothetical protein n=1 Tax=Nocardia gipuzkoensis TaxID=2749991 RepID=UPI0015EEECAC|nr:hypothetical protein [Nocardia gipuzkoensis]